MQQLIKITVAQDGKQTISAKELYIFLGYDKGNWAVWAKKNIIENEFAVENEDWVAFLTIRNGNETKDFALTLEFAKKLSMLARTEKGEQARKYFLECEKLALQGQTVKLPTPKELAQMLIEAENAKEQLQLEKERLAVQNQQQTKALQQAAPKVQFVDAVLQSTGTVTSTVIAKELSMSAIAMHELLKNKGYIYKTAQGQWVVKSPYDREGYAETRTVDYVGSNSEQKFTIYTVWTQKGRCWVHGILNPKLQAKPLPAPIMPVMHQQEKKKPKVYERKTPPRLLNYVPIGGFQHLKQ